MKRKPLTRWISFIFLIVSVGFFILVTTTTEKGTEQVIWYLLFSIAFGMISFFTFLATFVKGRELSDFEKGKHKPKRKKRLNIGKFWLISSAVVIIYLFIPHILANYYINAADTYRRAGQYPEAINSYIKAKNTLFWTIADNTQQATIDNKIAQTELEASPSPTSTPIPVRNTNVNVGNNSFITCNISAECGGGSHQVTKSECDIETCCSISSNCGGGGQLMSKTECNNKTCCQVNEKWMYISKSECVSLQISQQNLELNVNNSARQEATEKAANLETCVNTAFAEKKTCEGTCTYWYSIGDNTKGSDCLDQCVSFRDIKVDVCYQKYQ